MKIERINLKKIMAAFAIFNMIAVFLSLVALDERGFIIAMQNGYIGALIGTVSVLALVWLISIMLDD